MEAVDRYFQWWHLTAARYLDTYRQHPLFLKSWGSFLEPSLQFKKMADQAVDEMWRQFRLPGREDITRLQERLNFLESRLAELQEQEGVQLSGLENELEALKKMTVRFGLKIDALPALLGGPGKASREA
jgi:hypothetical protein